MRWSVSNICSNESMGQKTPISGSRGACWPPGIRPTSCYTLGPSSRSACCVVDFAGRPGFSVDALARDLERAAPRYLVLERNNRDSASGWRIEDVYTAPAVRRLLDGYTPEAVIEDFTVLRRGVQ